MPKNSRKERKKRKAARGGGPSMLVPKEREVYQEGGMPTELPADIPQETLMGMPQGMADEVPEMAEDAPVDTYTPEDQANAEETQMPDEQMEDTYIEFILNESLVPEEQEYLMNVLETDPQLSQIFDKVVDTASEFSGAGEVKGPGDGVSDSIPARLSDGEFVFTQKATEELGADQLQTMMDDAERAYDGGIMRAGRYLGGTMSGDKEELRLDN